MFYDVFLSLCDVHGTTPIEVRKRLGISQSTMASWKSRGLTPSAGMAVRIANYFGVSVDYLLGYEDMIEKPYDTYDAYKKKKPITFNSSKLENAISIGMDRERIDEAFNKLNRAGQQEAVKRIEELTEIPRYRRPEPAQPPAEASPSQDTPAAQDAPEGDEKPE